MSKYKDLECILLIDDDEATNYFNKYIIDSMDLDLDVHTVLSGKEGLDFLSCEGKYSNEKTLPKPGLIFLDINMPAMNGWEFLDHYEKLETEKKGRIILAMLTTSINPDDKGKAEQYDLVDDFIHKPLSEEKMLNLINAHFEKK